MMNDYRCEICGISFKTYEKNRKYCSHKCSAEGRSLRVEVSCSWCGRVKKVKLFEFKKTKNFFCNDHECKANWQSENLSGKNSPLTNKKEFICCNCGKTVLLSDWEERRGLRIFCNRECYKEYARGENSPNWKVDRNSLKTTQNLAIRNSSEMKDWRISVYERDNYKCQICGERGSIDLNAHHIEKFSKNHEERFSVDNGLTLCIKCHRKTFKKEEMYENYFKWVVSQIL